MKSKLNYDRKVRTVNYQVNEQVWLNNKMNNSSKKFSAKWIGPYIVINKINNLNYTIKPANRKGKRLIVHINRLKRCFTRATPTESNTNTATIKVEDQESLITQQLQDRDNPSNLDNTTSDIANNTNAGEQEGEIHINITETPMVSIPIVAESIKHRLRSTTRPPQRYGMA